MITPREIEAIAADLSIDLAAEWRCDEAFLSLHTTAQLKALAREWQMMESTATKRADLQAFILAQSKDRPQPLPKSLAKLKPVAL